MDQDAVHVAYSAFVLEHLPRPFRFWRALHNCLVQGGVFWGFTVDSRHPFAAASASRAGLHVKDRYLDWLRGSRGTERYENYRTFYSANTPGQSGQRHHVQAAGLPQPPPTRTA